MGAEEEIHSLDTAILISKPIIPESQIIDVLDCLLFRNKKGRAISDPAFHSLWYLKDTYFFLLLILSPTRPIKPVPKRIIVAGSGTGDGGVSPPEKKLI